MKTKKTLFSIVIIIVTIIFFAHISVFSQTGVSGKTHPRYYAIAGSYSTLQDANDAVDNYKLKGFASEVVGLTSYGTYRVAFCSFDDKAATLKEISKIKEQGYSSVWLYTGSVTDTDVNNNALVTNNQNQNNTTSITNTPDDLKKALDRADNARIIAKQSNTKEDWQDAINEYKKVIEIDSTYTPVYYVLESESEIIEDYNNAIKYYNKLLKLTPKSNISELENIQTNINNLKSKIDKNKKQEKIIIQEQPLKFNTEDEKATALKKAINRADAAEDIAKQSNSKEDWQSVIDEYKSVAKIDPTYSLIYYKLGYASETIEDYDNAIIYYNKYLQLDPNSTIAEKVQTNVDKLEYKRDKTKQQVVSSKSVNGIWKSDLINRKSGRPYWIFTIDQFDNDMRVSISHKSLFYKKTFTFPTAIALKEKSKLHFMFTTDVTINTKEALTASSNIIYALEGVQQAVSSIPFAGAAAGIIGAIPTKDKNKMQTYIFSIDLSDTNKLVGKYNAKEYLTPKGGTSKTLSDSIKMVTFTKMNQAELDGIKIKYKNKISGFGAFCLSLASPAFGQLLNKQYGKFAYMGIPQMICAIGIANGFYNWDLSLAIPSLVIGSAFHIISMIDAAISAHKINKEYGLAYNSIYENKDFCLKLNPTITTLAYSGKPTVATGLGLSLCFK